MCKHIFISLLKIRSNKYFKKKVESFNNNVSFPLGMCPVLCSGNGDYEDGICRCFPGWKGIECQLRSNECEVADCNGHGKCVNGLCVCARGFTGEHCKEGNRN